MEDSSLTSSNLADAIKDIAHRSWKVLNDSYETSLALQYPALVIAAACVYIVLGLEEHRINEDRTKDMDMLLEVLISKCPPLCIEGSS